MTMGGEGEYAVRVRHDPEAGVWFVESSDIPGLNVESPSLDGLIEVVRDVAPELIEHNLKPEAGSGSAYAISIQYVVEAPRLSAA